MINEIARPSTRENVAEQLIPFRRLHFAGYAAMQRKLGSILLNFEDHN
jgi:hypothetical protein